MKKWILPPLFALAVGVTLSGCSAGTANTMTPTTAPATTQPVATMAPANSPETTAQTDIGGGATMGMTTAEPTVSAAPAGMTPAEAGKLAEKIADAVERLSEVDDAEVVLSENRVLVAVEFEDQYSAGLDERMKQMITQKVQEVDNAFTEVQITNDETLYGQVKGLGERVAKVTGLDELADDFGDLWNRVTGM